MKVHVHRLRAGGARAASLHLRYIERDGVEQDGSKGVLYGRESAVSREAFGEPRPGERHQFRMWVHPEIALDAQVAQLGGVWLDRVDARSLAPYGLGLEVRRALERRRGVLAERGRGHEVPSGAAVAERQRRAVGEGIAARTGRVFLVDAPRGFRGRLEAGPEGSAFAVVSDGRRFVLVAASRDLAMLVGKSVEVERQVDGKLRVRERDREMGF